MCDAYINRASIESQLAEKGVELHYPRPDINDLYIGRLILGTEDLVEDLEKLFPQKTFSAHGLAVIPLMRRSRMSGFANREEILDLAMCNIYDTPGTFLPIVLGERKSKYKGSSAAARLDFTLEQDGHNTMQDEINHIHEAIYSSGVGKFQRFIPVLRLVEHIGEPKIAQAELIAEAHSFRKLELTPPVICGIPKK